MATGQYWHLGARQWGWSPSGSEAYVRTSLSIVSKAQKDIAERVRSSRGGIDWLGEQEV